MVNEFMRFSFNQILKAVHKNAIMGTILPDEVQVQVRHLHMCEITRVNPLTVRHCVQALRLTAQRRLMMVRMRLLMNLTTPKSLSAEGPNKVYLLQRTDKRMYW